MTTTSTSPVTMRPRVAALAVGGAVGATALLWAVAQILNIDLRVDPRNGQPPGVIGLPFAATVTLVISVLGWGARALLDRLTRRAPVIWAMIAVVLVLVSFLPLFAVEATGGTRAILALMHLAVGAVLIPVFGRRTV
ncbi:DUF6069 family protein [Streptosporangium sp. NPDC049046]|uniref:DUF6069 family protein n=1 Tax=unclassified Streptosporangium TaxID=2632669 RepID=UPI0034452BC8